MTATNAAPKRPRARRATAGDLSERLIPASIELFWAKGFADTNTRDIAEACGVSPGAMYFYYRSKAELLFRVLKETHDKWQRLYTEAVVDAGSDPADQLHALIRSSALFHAAHYKEALVANREFKFLDPQYADQIRSARRHLHHLWETVVQRGLDSGAFKSPGPAPRPARQITIILGNMCNQIAEWYDPKRELSPEQLADFYARSALVMVGARRD